MLGPGTPKASRTKLKELPSLGPAELLLPLARPATCRQHWPGLVDALHFGSLVPQSSLLPEERPWQSLLSPLPGAPWTPDASPAAAGGRIARAAAPAGEGASVFPVLAAPGSDSAGLAHTWGCPSQPWAAGFGRAAPRDFGAIGDFNLARWAAATGFSTAQSAGPRPERRRDPIPQPRAAAALRRKLASPMPPMPRWLRQRMRSVALGPPGDGSAVQSLEASTASLPGAEPAQPELTKAPDEALDEQQLGTSTLDERKLTLPTEPEWQQPVQAPAAPPNEEVRAKRRIAMKGLIAGNVEEAKLKETKLKDAKAQRQAPEEKRKKKAMPKPGARDPAGKAAKPAPATEKAPVAAVVEAVPEEDWDDDEEPPARLLPLGMVPEAGEQEHVRTTQSICDSMFDKVIGHRAAGEELEHDEPAKTAKPSSENAAHSGGRLGARMRRHADSAGKRPQDDAAATQRAGHRPGVPPPRDAAAPLSKPPTGEAAASEKRKKAPPPLLAPAGVKAEKVSASPKDSREVTVRTPQGAVELKAESPAQPVRRRMLSRAHPKEPTPGPNGSPRSGKDFSPAAAEAPAAPAEKQQEKTAPKSKEEQAAISHKELVALRVSVFNKLKDDGEIHMDCLPQALTMLGFIAPDQSFIEEVFSSLTSYASLSLDDFMKFARGYKVRQDQAYAEAFERCDEDNSGRVVASELKGLLHSFGIQPMTHVLHECIAEVDEDGEGELNLQEFETLMGILRGREGFTMEEYESIMRVYARFDHEGAGEISTKEMVGVLNWLGYAMSRDKVAEIVGEVDIDKSSSINTREFLTCMRKIREEEIRNVITVLEEHKASGEDRKGSDQMQWILKAIGYRPSEAAVDEAITDAGYDSGDTFDLSTVWQVLSVYRSKEGFCKVEEEEIAENFKKFCKKDTSEIAALEVGQMMRTMGYSLTVSILQDYIARVDVDNTGTLDFDSAKKLIRMYREEELYRASVVFEQFAGGYPGISTPAVTLALGELGLLEQKTKYLPEIKKEDKVSAQTLFATGGSNRRGSARLANQQDLVDLKGFLRIFVREARRARQLFRENSGFSATEVEALRELFKYYDADNSGDIRAKEQIKFIQDNFPEMANDRGMRPDLLKILYEIGQNKDDSLTFSDFLRLLRRLCEIQDCARLAKEQEAIKETGFSHSEVNGFRELFLMSSDGTDLGLFEVIRLINKLTPLGDKFVKELTVIVREVNKTCDSPGVRDTIDFPEYLHLMRRLLDENFARIREKTSSKR